MTDSFGGAPVPADFYDKKPLANYQSTIWGVLITFLILCWLTTAARLWTRYIITKTPGWDDLFVILTVVHYTIGVIAMCLSTKFGMGQHIYLLAPGELRKYLICHWLIGVSYVSSTAYIKISLLLQYMRVFEKGSKTYRFSQFMLVIIGLWGFSFIFMGWFACFPSPAAFWNGTNKGCYASYSPIPSVVIKTIEGHSGANVIFDLIVLAIPFRLLFLDDAPLQKKGLMALLLMGFLTVGFSIWRLQNIVSTKAGFFPTPDPTWNVPTPFLVSFCEVGVASICACTPFFWPLITQQWDKIFVTYEFKVSTESRYRDEELELASTDNWPARTGSYSGKHDPEVRSLEADNEGRKQYGDNYTQHQVNPYTEEFRTETGVNVDKSGKKGGNVRFGSNPFTYLPRVRIARRGQNGAYDRI